MYSHLIRIDELVREVSLEISRLLRSNLYEVSLRKEEANRFKKRKNQLRNALKSAGLGDLHAKEFIKGNIMTMLGTKFKVTSSNINEYIPFDNSLEMTVIDKFDVILFLYIKLYGKDAMSEILEVYGRNNKECRGCKIDNYIIERLYNDNIRKLSYEEKLEVLTQRVYSKYCGLGVIDDIRDMKLDGVLGGVSGGQGDYKNIWVAYKGVMYHLSFLDFESEDELIRICSNIYRYDNPGQLSRAKGYIVGEMADHSRIVVVRPPFAESWAFFVRKFDNIEKKEIKELITDMDAHIPINIIKWIVKGCQVTAITGMQGSGKTTLLMSLIEFISPLYTLRVQEMSFELHLREVYRDRNILTFRETDSISGEEGLDIQKKTDGNVNILGEIASNRVAAWMIQTAQSGSIFTMFTHHARTTESLIKYLRNSLLACNIFANEKIALEQVVDVIRFDIHINKSEDGKRYIERISEIIPCDNEKGYKIRDIVIFDGMRYKLVNIFSEDVIRDIRMHLSKEARREFDIQMSLYTSV